MKESNIIEWLNSSVDGGDVLITLIIVFAVWYLVWRFLLCEWLRKHKVGSFAYAMYELGAFGIYGLALFFTTLLVLFFSSIQLVIAGGIKAAFPVIVFWTIIVAFFYFIAKAILKKK